MADSNLLTKIKSISNQLKLCLLYCNGIITGANPRVPMDYTEIEYLYTSDNSYFNTGYIHKANTKVVTKMNITSSTAHSYIFLFGARNASYSKNSFNLFSRFNGSNVFTYSRSGAETKASTATYGTDIIITAYQKVCSWVNANTGASISSITTSGTADAGICPMAIFCCNQSSSSGGWSPEGSTQARSTRLYYFKIYETDTLIHEFVPVKRNSDNVIGLYDIVTGKFIVNVGSGSLTAGPEIIHGIINTENLVLNLLPTLSHDTYWVNEVNDSNVTIYNGSRDDDNDAIVFNGTNTYISTNIAQSSGTSGYTVIVRFKPNSWSNYKGIFGIHDSGSTGGIVGLQYENGNVCYAHRAVTGIAVPYTNENICTGKWHTAICRFNGSTLNLILDGNDMGTSNVSPLKAQGNFIFGKSFESSDRYFNGLIKHIMIYTRYVNDDEISMINKYVEAYS